MGIKNFIKVIKHYSPNAIKYTTIEDYKNKTLGIDITLMIYKNILAINKNNVISLKNAHIHSMINKLNAFRKYKINPIFVFDGLEYPKIKEKTLAKRKSLVAHQEIEDCKELIRLYGYQVIEAKGEADKVLVELGYPIVSDDMDMLIFGGNTLIKGFTISKNKEMMSISLKSILKTIDITQKQLIDIALILGTDYEFMDINGIGPIKAVQNIKQYKSLPNMIKINKKKYDIVTKYFLSKDSKYIKLKKEIYSRNKIILFLNDFDYDKIYYDKYIKK